MLPIIREGIAENRILYAEDIFEARGVGIIQAIRDDYSKYIRNLTHGTEEYYNLSKDPDELNNIIEQMIPEEILKLRKKLNSYLMSSGVTKNKNITEKQKKIIDKRLRSLGYIE